MKMTRKELAALINEEVANLDEFKMPSTGGIGAMMNAMSKPKPGSAPAPKMAAMPKNPQAAGQQEANFDGNTGKSLGHAGDAIIMAKAGINVKKHMEVMQASADDIKKLVSSVASLTLPSAEHNKLSPAGMKTLGTFHQAVIDFNKKFNEALRYFHTLQGVEAGRAATGLFTGNKPPTPPPPGKPKTGIMGKIAGALSMGKKAFDAYKALKESGTLNEMRLNKGVFRYSLGDHMPELLGESNSYNALCESLEELNEFKLFKTKDSELAGASTTDAYTLYKAMKGMGTDEKMIQKVIADRKNDLKNLSDEYGKLLQVAGEKDDLATWLTDDGMAAEAQMVQSAVAGGGTKVGAAASAAPAATPGVAPAAAGAAGAGAVTAPEITSIAQLPPGSKQQPDKSFVLPDGRRTPPIMAESLSRGSLIRRRYGRY